MLLVEAAHRASHAIPRGLSSDLKVAISSRFGSEIFPSTYFPVPATEMVCGEPAALSVTPRDAVNDPVEPGLKTTEIKQLAPAGKDDPQLLVSENEAAFVPVMAIPPIARVAVPGFCTATVWATLAVPTACAGNVSADVENEINGTSGEIVNLSACDVPPPGAGFVTVTEAVPLVARSDAGTIAVKTVAST